jgi:tetratricopeptide (TPR) repeat protein
MKQLELQQEGKSNISPIPPVLPPFASRNDRVGKYLKRYLKLFVFDEFSPKFVNSMKNMEYMTGVPIPLRKEDVEAFQGGSGLKVLHIAENMAWIMGIDPNFRYVPEYVRFMNQFFNYKILEGLVKEGRNAAEDGDLDNALIHFRAALVLKPDYIHAMYSYARACREKYLHAEKESVVGNYKAEAMEYFEHLTMVHPRFTQGYYYLGYAYLNMGLYIKASLTWQEYMKKSRHFKDRREISQRLKQIQQPTVIEQGCNSVLAGRWEEGIATLEPFMETEFKTWWPMSYYLGVAYARTGNNSQAIASLKRALSYNSSHVESMQELAEIYAGSKDKENEKKYRSKAELVLANSEKTRQESNEEESDQ